MRMNEKQFHILFLGGSRQIRIVDRETTVVATVDVYDDKIQYFVDKLNEQQSLIQSLKEENEHLRQSVEFGRKNMKREQKHFK